MKGTTSVPWRPVGLSEAELLELERVGLLGAGLRLWAELGLPPERLERALRRAARLPEPGP